METDRLLPGVLELMATAAGRIVEIAARQMVVDYKADDSPLTAADLASHEVLTGGLQDLTPDWPVLSEESAALPWSVRRKWQRYWLVDPLDGTKEFIQRRDSYTINVALIDHGRPVLGAVGAPARNTFWYATGGSAWRRDHGGQVHRLHSRRPSSSPPVVVASLSHRSPVLENYLASLGEHRDISIGSALKFCLIAEGEADFYPRLGLTSEWDTAAGQCVVEAAGGIVRRFDDEPLLYNTKESLINPWFYVRGDPEARYPPLPPQPE